MFDDYLKDISVTLNFLDVGRHQSVRHPQVAKNLINLQARLERQAVQPWTDGVCTIPVNEVLKGPWHERIRKFVYQATEWYKFFVILRLVVAW
ncbi:MAG: hypothetical protein ABI603_06400 [Acidobacteriota bacterium]